MGILKWIFPKEKDFYGLLYGQSCKTLEGIEALSKYMHIGNIEESQKVIELENEADELRRVIIDTLDNTFITPFEREDIFKLSGAMDDIVDYAKTTVEEMEIYELEPTDSLISMVDILLDATTCLNTAVKYLKDHRAISAENAVKAKQLENDMETHYRLNLKDLVRNEDFSYVFRMREVYRHLSNMADKIDLTANMIHNILVKLV
jgi:uncharacterized protein Yka (UPF0111/DUF47 family)